MNPLNIVICVDDVHPAKDWGLPDDAAIQMMLKLYQTFGAKFTLFVPSNYHGSYKLSDHKKWVEWYLDHPAFELAAHGHLHMTTDPKRYGECEFIDTIDYEQRIIECQAEWAAVGHSPKSWRNPGWLCSQILPSIIISKFPSITHVALHSTHNRGLVWYPLKEVFGHDDIQSSELLLHDDNTIMYQSHIFGAWNKNTWTPDNFEILEASLTHLHKQTIINFTTVSEL